MEPGLDRFLLSFVRALELEMEAIRREVGPQDVALSLPLETESDAHGESRARFELHGRRDAMTVGAECRLAFRGGERLVTVVTCDERQIVLQCSSDIPGDRSDYRLVLYPWFLYERLVEVLSELEPSAPSELRVEPAPPGDRRFPETALRLFGALPEEDPDDDHRAANPSAIPLGHLNASQRRAVELAARRSTSFVWGPPGTGKTETLAHILARLLHANERTLLVSTTNAALDQALDRAVTHPALAGAAAEGSIVRIGRAGDGAQRFEVGAIARERAARIHARETRLGAQLARHRRRLDLARACMRDLAHAASGQRDLFAGDPEGLGARPLAHVFGRLAAARLARRVAPSQLSALELRGLRLERAIALGQAARSALRAQRAAIEASVIADARIVAATLTNSYFNRALARERFDTLVVDEAGMAILPSLFYAATAARHRVVVVGDPKQLPPITQSRDPYVRRAMGRSIFEVDAATAGRPVVLLDTQYRMHPTIGRLVADLFYDGRLSSDVPEASTRAVVAAEPFPDAALVVVDTRGRARARVQTAGIQTADIQTADIQTADIQTAGIQTAGRSRSNVASANACVSLATRALAAGVQTIAVITPYAEQARLVRQKLPRGATGTRVECRTVHRFQGHERDLVIFDAVDSEPLRPGILLSDRSPGSQAANLLNVSLSRARGKLIVIADVAYFRMRAPGSPIARVVEAAQARGRHASLSDT